jgi:hypothetical protein
MYPFHLLPHGFLNDVSNLPRNAKCRQEQVEKNMGGRIKCGTNAKMWKGENLGATRFDRYLTPSERAVVHKLYPYKCRQTICKSEYFRTTFLPTNGGLLKHFPLSY